MKRTTLAVVVALAALSIGLAAVLSPSAKAAAAPPAPSAAPAIDLARAEPVKAGRTEELSGALQPRKALALGFEVQGRLAKILVRKGASVAEGQLLAQLDTELSDAMVAQAQAALAAAEAQAATASDVSARNQKLAGSGAVTELQLKTSASTAEGARAQVLAARAQLAAARANRHKLDLRAPFAGVVVDAPDQVGAAVSSANLLFKLEQLDTLTLKLTVPESARSGLKVGSPVPVEAVSGLAKTDAASVRLILPSADPVTRRIPVEVEVPNKDHRFTANTLARARLPLGQEQSALALPSTALSSSGGDHVFVVGKDSEVRRIPVQVIAREADRVVIHADQPLERVVDAPADDLTDGSKVKVR